MRRLCLVVAAFFCCQVCSSAVARDWFMDAENNCSGDQAAIAAFSALLPSSVKLKNGSSSLYAVFGVTMVDSILGNSGEMIVDRLVLNKPQAHDYKTAMGGITANYDVPYVIEVQGAIFTGLLPPVVGGPAGLIFSYLVNTVNASVAGLKSVTLFIVEGGSLERRWKILRNANKETYAASILEYFVPVGSEKRRFVTQGCIYPVDVFVSQFETTFTSANKIVKPHGAAGEWGVWDVDDKKWDSTILKFTEQQGEFYYFAEDAIEDGMVKGQHIHRISFEGGLWQFKNFFDGTGASFKSLAPNMKSS